ncbi:MAG: type II toxin-antitoxin system VapB family antitoxin [Kiritimatiellae bacterium]|nr:type II toxin-antitoxin system VapB family antitoxin [Kiritimatiellia bacterium]
MRTNIEIDDGLLEEAFRYSATRSKKALVHEALAAYVTVKQEERRRLSYRERLQNIRAASGRLRGATQAHDIVRRDRDTRLTRCSSRWLLPTTRP